MMLQNHQMLTLCENFILFIKCISLKISNAYLFHKVPASEFSFFDVESFGL